VTSILQEVMQALGHLSGHPMSVFQVKAKVGVAGMHFSIFVAFFRVFGLSLGNNEARGDVQVLLNPSSRCKGNQH
jgi:hypothetical protein